MIITTRIVVPLGTVAIAANSFAVTAESLCFMPGYGIADAATTLVGQSIEAGRRELVRRFSHLIVMLGMGVMAVILSVPLGLTGVWIAMYVELCFRGVLFLFRLKRERWMEKAAYQQNR